MDTLFIVKKGLPKEEQKKEPIKFIKKLLDIVSNTSYNHTISWSADGKYIEIRDEVKFKEHLLPSLFKHNNFSNFVRQLNMYNFRKVKDNKENCSTYFNPFFNRSDLSNLHLIKRKDPKIDICMVNNLIESGCSDKSKSKDKLTLSNSLQQQTNKYQTLLKRKHMLYHSVNTKENYIKYLESFVFYLLDQPKLIQEEIIKDDFLCQVNNFHMDITKKIKSLVSNNPFTIDNPATTLLDVQGLNKKDEDVYFNTNKADKVISFKNELKGIFNPMSFISSNNTEVNTYENILKLNSNVSMNNPYSSYKNMYSDFKPFKQIENKEDPYFECSVISDK